MRLRLRGSAFAASLSVIGLVALPTGCSDSATGPDAAAVTAVLASLTTTVILPSFLDIETKATALATASANFNTTASQANMDALQLAWREARQPWESSETFLFGPAETGGYDPAMDSWPVNTTDINLVLSGAATLNAAYINTLTETSKGFHGMEYVLFGTTSAKTLAQFTVRDRQYLAAAAASFAASATALRAAWVSDYAAQLSTAGSSGSLYGSPNDAMQEVVAGMSDLMDELANEKIAGPQGPPVDLTQEESRFSANSTVDYTNNIRSVRNMYLGTRDGTNGTGVSTLVVAADPTLDATVRTQITAAINATAALTPTFSQALTSSPALVQTAKAAILTLMTTLTDQVQPLVAP